MKYAPAHDTPPIEWPMVEAAHVRRRARQIAAGNKDILLGASIAGRPWCRLSGWRGGVGLSGHDRSFRFFLGYQLQEQLPLNVVLARASCLLNILRFSRCTNSSIRILLSEELVQVGDPRSRPASRVQQARHRVRFHRIGFGGRGVDGMAADVLKRSDVTRGRAMMLSAAAPGIAVPQGGS